MPLTPHFKLGSFEILEMVGAGGMGEVYRARDTRLERTVAIKILPPGFPHSGGARERFEREARSISSLNHPNICVLHDIGSQEGIDFLVLEFLEGQSLAAILDRGALPAPEAVRLGLQIAAALDAAHRAGVLHRDLKPGNVIVTRTGAKLLDFGLAKMVRPPLAGAEALTQTVTAAGTIQGTLQYMAPEQLEGREADARSDIFAFGCVMYEMLTGRKAFPGDTAASVIGSIMSSRPAPLGDEAGAIPAALGRLVDVCLAKDPGERFQTACDLRRALEWSSDPRPAPVAAPAHRSRTAWALPLVCLIAAGLLGWALARGRTAPPARPALRFALGEPEGAWLQHFITQQSIVISPTGGRIAMIASGPRGPQIWIRSLDTLAPAPLPGTEGALILFWSPDSKSLAFFAGGTLKRIALGGGAPVPICDLAGAWSGTWGANGEILVGLARGNTMRINAANGVITRWKPAMWPRFLPDGKRVVYLTSQPDGLQAQLEDLSTGKVTPLAKTNTLAIFAPDPNGGPRGHLLFGRDSTLLAQPLDLDHPEAPGEAVPVVEQVPYFRPTGWSEFDASADGHLVFGHGKSTTSLVWTSREGTRTPVPGDPLDYWNNARRSPGSSMRIAADVYDLARGGADLWVLDERTGAAERLTFDPGVEASPVWSPDGRRIAFGSAQRAAPQLRVLTLGDGSPPVEYAPAAFQLPTDWSPDGRWIAYQTSGGDVSAEIWFASAGPDRKVYPVIQRQPFESAAPAFSPDGKYLAYSSNEGGRGEVYVQAIDNGTPPHTSGSRLRVSLNGGTVPRWRRDGGELFFLSPDLTIMSSLVKRGDPIAFGPPVRVANLSASINSMIPGGFSFDCDAGGQNFLSVQRARPKDDHLQIILNWQSMLKH